MSTFSLNHQWSTTYGTITMQSNGHGVPANGCFKCQLEQMARRWSQGDLAISNRAMQGVSNTIGITSWPSDLIHTQFPPDIRPCRGKYFLLKQGSNSYLLQFPCCRSR